MTVSFWQRAWRQPSASYDVAVVGGGVVGAATAFWLGQERPGWRVALVEAHTVGFGASGRNAGFLLQGGARDYLADVRAFGARRARRLWHFTRTNRDLVASTFAPEAVGFEGQGSLTVAGDAAEDERLQASLPHLRAAGAPVVYCLPEETNHRLGARGFRGSLFVTSGAAVDPLRLVRALASRSGAEVLEHCAVLALDPRSGRTVLETPTRTLEAGRVVLTLGAHLPQVVPALSRFVRPVRAQMLATAKAPERVLPLPAYSHEGHYYARQTPTGHVLVGGARHRHEDTEVGYADATTPALQADLERYLHTHFPWTRGLPVARRWSGTMAFSPDGLPVVGTVPGVPGSLWASGFTGHGMGYGVHMGRLLSALVQGGRPSALDLFAVRRFTRPTAPPASTTSSARASSA
jgi:glycine/D-amino acid oxidase-like deaminating enzyme